MRTAKFILPCLIAAGAEFAVAETLAIENPEGDVDVTVVAGNQFKIDGLVAGRELNKTDVRVEKIGDTVFVDALPADLTPINLLVKIPHGWPLSIRTISGNIRVNGNITSGFIETGTGSINLAVPLKTTALFVESEEQPEALLIPPQVGYIRETDAKKGLRIETKQSRPSVIEIRAFSPSRLFVRDYLPAATENAEEPLALELARPRLSALKAAQSRIGPAGERRVVVSVRSKAESPALQVGDFEVIENGEPRRLTRIESASIPINVALVFQKVETRTFRSTSTRRDRAFLLRLIRQLRASDSIALAQAEGGFLRVVSNFSTDRSQLRRAYLAAPPLDAMTELVAATVLAQQRLNLGDIKKRNVAVIVNSVGDYDCVTRAADKEMAAAVEILARTGTLFYAVGGNCGDISRLAKLSGGRTIELGIGKAERVADRLAEELATLYSVSYTSELRADQTPDRFAVKVRGKAYRVRHGPSVPLR